MRLRYRDWDWRAIDDAALDDLEAALRTIFDDFPIGGSPNESQTENDLIWPVLARLGWTASLQQQNLSATGREDVPDGLLFADMATKDRANRFAQDCKRYGLGLAVVESKRWLRPLDRRSGQHGEETAPSTQMLRYLRRIDDHSQPAISARESLNNLMFAVSRGRGGLDVKLDDIADRPGAALVTGYGANRRYPRRSAFFPAVPPAAGRLLPCHPVA